MSIRYFENCRKKAFLKVSFLIFMLIIGCREEYPIEIRNTTVGLYFETKKDVYVFYDRLEKDYCKKINIRDYATSYAEFLAYNPDWYNDTIYIKIDADRCVSLEGEKHTAVFIRFLNRNGKDILKNSVDHYYEIKKYFNQAYIETVK